MKTQPRTVKLETLIKELPTQENAQAALVQDMTHSLLNDCDPMS